MHKYDDFDERLGINKKMLYNIPANYFDNLNEKVFFRIKKEPVLSDVNIKPPFVFINNATADAYFNKLNTRILNRIKTEKFKAKLIWFRVAAAAVIIFSLVMTTIYIANDDVFTGKSGEARIGSLKDTELKNFMYYDSLNYKEHNQAATEFYDFNQLLKALPENTLQNFLEETATPNDELIF